MKYYARMNQRRKLLLIQGSESFGAFVRGMREPGCVEGRNLANE